MVAFCVAATSPSPALAFCVAATSLSPALAFCAARESDEGLQVWAFVCFVSLKQNLIL